MRRLIHKVAMDITWETAPEALTIAQAAYLINVSSDYIEKLIRHNLFITHDISLPRPREAGSIKIRRRTYRIEKASFKKWFDEAVPDYMKIRRTRKKGEE